MKKHVNIHMFSQLKKAEQADTDYQNLKYLNYEDQ